MTTRKMTAAWILTVNALLAFVGASASLAQQMPQPAPAPRIQPSRPIAPARAPIIAPRRAPQPAAQPMVQPQNIQPNGGPNMQPGAIPTGVTPAAGRPLNIQGIQAPTPFWWGPSVGTPRPPRRSGPIPGAYTPAGRPAVLIQPPAYPPPGAPVRFQNELSYGPLPSPGPDLPNDGLGPIRPITDPHPQSALPPRINHHDRIHFGGSGFNRNVVLHGGSGLLVRGRVEGDNFRLGFTLGGGVPFLVDRFGFARDCGNFYRFCRRCDFFGGGYPLYYGYDDSYYAPIYGQLVTIDPSYIDPNLLPQQSVPIPQIDESTLPPLERGHLALENDRADDAVNYYQEHLAASAGDADAMRWLAVALLETGRIDAGVAMMALAYQTDPDLARSPLIASRFPGGAPGLAKRYGAAVAFAHSAKGSSAYLVAAVLAQAEGRSDAGRRLLAKSKAAGMDRPIVEALERALRK